MARKIARKSLLRRAGRIRLAVFDVDGVMTDGRLYIGPGGAEFKAVHIHDGHGLKKLTAADVEVAVISGRRSESMELRLSDLGIQHVFMGVNDKLAIFMALLQELSIEADETVYMGDDEPDLAPMREASLAFAVRNAVPQVLRAAHWVSRFDGGHGAVREACELLLAARR